MQSKKCLLVKLVTPCCSRELEPWECEPSDSGENSRGRSKNDQDGHPLKKKEEEGATFLNIQKWTITQFYLMFQVCQRLPLTWEVLSLSWRAAGPRWSCRVCRSDQCQSALSWHAARKHRPKIKNEKRMSQVGEHIQCAESIFTDEQTFNVPWLCTWYSLLKSLTLCSSVDPSLGFSIQGQMKLKHKHQNS